MIIATYSGATYEAEHQPKPQRNPHRAKVDVRSMCSRCDLSPVAEQSLCATCISHKRRYGVDRPQRLIDRARERKDSPKWCGNCGEPEVFLRLRCENCYQYRKRNGQERPEWIWNDDFPCLTCGYPKSACPISNRGKRMFNAGRCAACYCYLHETKVERPRYLWGIGSLGWCNCGRPAEHKFDGFKLCNICIDHVVIKTKNKGR